MRAKQTWAQAVCREQNGRWGNTQDGLHSSAAEGLQWQKGWPARVNQTPSCCSTILSSEEAMLVVGTLLHSPREAETVRHLSLGIPRTVCLRAARENGRWRQCYTFLPTKTTFPPGRN